MFTTDCLQQVSLSRLGHTTDPTDRLLYQQGQANAQRSLCDVITLRHSGACCDTRPGCSCLTQWWANKVPPLLFYTAWLLCRVWVMSLTVKTPLVYLELFTRRHICPNVIQKNNPVSIWMGSIFDFNNLSVANVTTDETEMNPLPVAGQKPPV